MKYSFEIFQKQAIINYLDLDKYKYIIDNLYKCDVSKDEDYQVRFNAFYKVRRDKNWRKNFYNYFESIKNKKNITFEEILSYMYKTTGNIEASFCSKLLSTINHSMPIWDQFVLSNLKLSVKSITKEDRLKETIDVYNKIIEIENKKLEEKGIKQSINDFKKYFVEYDLSDIKILDYILWSSRENDTK